MKLKLSIGMLCVSFAAFGADTLTLTDCYKLAIENFPVLRQQALYEEAYALKLRNLQAGFLPGFSLNGQASYQSEVVDLPFSVPNAEPLGLPHERWQVVLDMHQTIFDGGLIKANKALEQEQLEIDQQQVLVEVQQLKSQINQVYLAILLAEHTEEVFQASIHLLEEKVKALRAGLKGGVVLESDVLKIEAEILKLRQRRKESKENSKAGRTILEILTGRSIEENTILKIPAPPPIDLQEHIARPELKLLEYQQQKLAGSSRLTQTKLLPKIAAFAQGGYGYPNPYNFFDASVSSFYLIGARINWNIWDWNTAKREKEAITVQAKLLDTKKEHLDRSIRIQLEQQLADVARLQSIIQEDQAIVEIQEKIRSLTSAQLDHGVITTSSYLDEVNAEQQARLNLEMHRLQLVRAQINYLTEKGTYPNQP